MFAGVAGWFAAGTELVLRSGSGGRTSCKGSGIRFAGCPILVSSCGGVGGEPEGACCCAFSTGEMLTLVETRGNSFVEWPRVSTFSARWLGVLTVIAGKDFFAAFAGRGECFGDASRMLSIMLSIFSTGRGSTTEVCACVLLAGGLGTLGVVVTGGGVTGFIASLNAGVFCVTSAIISLRVLC